MHKCMHAFTHVEIFRQGPFSAEHFAIRPHKDPKIGPPMFRNSHIVPMIISTLNLPYINPKGLKHLEKKTFFVNSWHAGASASLPTSASTAAQRMAAAPAAGSTSEQRFTTLGPCKYGRFQRLWTLSVGVLAIRDLLF